MYIFKQEKSKDETTIFIVRKRKKKLRVGRIQDPYIKPMYRKGLKNW